MKKVNKQLSVLKLIVPFHFMQGAVQFREHAGEAGGGGAGHPDVAGFAPVDMEFPAGKVNSGFAGGKATAVGGNQGSASAGAAG